MRGPALVLLFAAGQALASPPSADEVLSRMEKNINGFDDQMMEVTITIVDVDGSRKSYDITIWQKGDQKRLIRFTSGEMKGMATLIEDRNRVHVYLPGFKKVRRVAAHNMNQSFAGSDLTNDDMASVSWTALWNAQIEGEDDQAYHLLCTPKPGVNAPYAKAKLSVDKKTFQQLAADYFDASGQLVKTWRMSEFKDFHGVLRASLVVVTDARTGHRTEMRVREFKVNLGLKDSLFSVRELEWGG